MAVRHVCGAVVRRIICGARIPAAFGAAFVLFASVVQAGAQCQQQGGSGGTRTIDFLLGTGNAVTSSVTAMNTAFQTQTAAFISSPAATQPNELASGAWIRGVGGRLIVDTQNSATFTRPTGTILGGGTFPVTCPSLQSTNDFTGVQGGYDFGRLNLGASGWSIHGGITGGYFKSTTKGPGAGTATAEVPFVGLYAALVRGGFYLDAQVRGEFYNLHASDPSLAAQGSTNANGISVISSVGYNWTIGNYFVEPSAGLVYSRTRIDPLSISTTVVPPFGPSTRTAPAVLNLDDIETLLGRVGLRVGTVFSVGEATLQPFVAASVWREGAGSTDMSVNFDIPRVSNNGTLNANSTRIGYFGQYSVGFSASVPNSGWLGYARVDYRNGQNIESIGVNGGLRYQFAPAPRLASAAAPMPVKAPPPAPIPSWTGFYVGAFLGGAWAAGDATTTELAPVFNGTGSSSTYQLGSTVIGGMTTGYNRQFGSLVAGIEAEGGYIHLTGSAPFTPERVATTSSTAIGDWYALLAGRFGVSVGPALLYAKVGGALLNVTSDVISAPCFVVTCGNVNATGNNSLRPAWVAGGGLEYALTNSWSIKGEYLYFGTDQSYNLSGVGQAFPPPNGGGPPKTFNWHQSVPGINTAKFGISYKFGAGPT